MRINYVLLFSPAVSCGTPVAPVNGGVLAPDYSAATRATYFCNEGFRLSSKEVTSTVCQADGTWSSHNKIPRCTGETIMKPNAHSPSVRSAFLFGTVIRPVETRDSSNRIYLTLQLQSDESSLGFRFESLILQIFKGAFTERVSENLVY